MNQITRVAGSFDALISGKCAGTGDEIEKSSQWPGYRMEHQQDILRSRLNCFHQVYEGIPHYHVR